jgi:uncharacterized protein
MQVFMLAMAGWALGGFVNGIVGFGAALVAMPVLAFGMDMTLAVPCAGLMVLALNVQMAWNYRRHLVCLGLGPLLIGALPGALAGALLLLYVSESGLRLGLGLLLAAYGLWGMLSRRLRRRDLGPVWAMLAGFLSTSFGTAYGINGPPLAVYLAARGGAQNETKAALGVFFIVSGVFVVAAQALAGAHSIRALQLFAVGLPAVLLGGWAGMRLSAGLNDAHFHAGLNLMLLLMGANMVRLALA